MLKKNWKKNKISTLLIAIVTCGAVVGFVTTFQHAVIATAPEAELPVGTSTLVYSGVATTSRQVSVTHGSYPDRLVIPAINVDAHVTDVGISKHGTMAVPVKFTDVGWYRYGPAPGELGNAVIAGHLDNGLGLAGVFKHLSELKPGDDIYVENALNEKSHFVVRSKQEYDYDTTVTGNVFLGPKDAAQLVLITCEGTWDQAHKTYSNRLVVTAELAG